MEAIPRAAAAHNDSNGSDVRPYHELLASVIYRSVIDYLDDTDNPEGGKKFCKREYRMAARAFFFGESSDDPETPWTFAWMAGFLSEAPLELMASIRHHLLTAKKRSETLHEARSLRRSA